MFPGPHSPSFKDIPSWTQYMLSLAQNDVLQALQGLILIRKVQNSPKRSFSIGFEGFLVLIALPCA